MTTQHTPTPWRAEEHPHSYFWTAIYGPENLRIAQVEHPMELSEQRRANAAFLVLAVNNYEALLETAKSMTTLAERMRRILHEYELIKELVGVGDEADGHYDGLLSMFEDARAAIAAAEGRG